jgi:hypothetical protein
VYFDEVLSRDRKMRPHRIVPALRCEPHQVSCLMWRCTDAVLLLRTLSSSMLALVSFIPHFAQTYTNTHTLARPPCSYQGSSKTRFSSFFVQLYSFYIKPLFSNIKDVGDTGVFFCSLSSTQGRQRIEKSHKFFLIHFIG